MSLDAVNESEIRLNSLTEGVNMQNLSVVLHDLYSCLLCT